MLRYKTGVAIQGNVAQNWWYSTIMVENTISNTGKFAKMVELILLLKMVVRILFTQTQKSNDGW